MKENEHIIPEEKRIIKSYSKHTCPECGSAEFVEQLACHPEDEPYDPANNYHWHCLDCGYKDYEYLPF